jgi:hypothetical protein
VSKLIFHSGSASKVSSDKSTPCMRTVSFSGISAGDKITEVVARMVVSV